MIVEKGCKILLFNLDNSSTENKDPNVGQLRRLIREFSAHQELRKKICNYTAFPACHTADDWFLMSNGDITQISSDKMRLNESSILKKVRFRVDGWNEDKN